MAISAAHIHPTYRSEADKAMVLFDFDQRAKSRRDDIIQRANDEVKKMEQRVRNKLALLDPAICTTLTMRELMERYQGNIDAATIGEREREVAMRRGPKPTEMDKKRKRIPTDNSEEHRSVDMPRPAKNARFEDVKDPVAAARTQGVPPRPARIVMAPSPLKKKPTARPPFNAGPSLRSSPRPLSRAGFGLPSRVPTAATFSPSLPPQMPAYPTSSSSSVLGPPSLNTQQTAFRMPRMNEKLLSVNGSPVANVLAAKQASPPSPLKSPGTYERIRTMSDIGKSARRPEPALNRAASMPPETWSLSVSLPTKDGGKIDFDPRETSPTKLQDTLTASARKLMDDWVRETNGALEKWML
ncbi:hypothetical protein CYLTODRAFT_488196 [Cylindrobasidium torrendii FP15055 ss-10]|uniref:Borealin N-terminal domain-containing protein n=1 Tax=Cylindrobasidium torrendii FP15055 ss-10 TaxID=1314674 RepID=A0A0D7BKZ1_9AGAR|nr:hypothetical protein CYLTODRAFT_488196 [Cylindrobasidium torrendii FP15055 ss-10]